MLAFLSLFLLTYGAMHLYALGKLARVLPHSTTVTAILVLAGIALTLSPMLVHFLEKQGVHATAVAWIVYLWMGYLLLFFLVGVAFDLVRTLMSLPGLRWTIGETMSFGTVAMVAATLLGWGYVEASRIRIERIDIATTKLASGKITIAQLSDVHLGIMHNEGFLNGIVAQLQELKPDIVVATGDIVDREGDNLAALATIFRGYAPPLGAYAVTGNHEHYAGLQGSLRFLENSGFHVLRDESVRVGRPSSTTIVLTGIDDPAALTFGQPVPGRLPIVSQPDDFVVLLKHQPVIEESPRFDLQLSGHIHGGQIFPLNYITRQVYGFDAGLTELEGGRTLYISRGTGTWGPPIRLLAPPEITLVTISASPPGNAPVDKGRS